MPKLKNVGLCGCCELHEVGAYNLLACYEGGFGLGVDPTYRHALRSAHAASSWSSLRGRRTFSNLTPPKLNTTKGLVFQDSGFVWRVQRGHWRS